MENPGKLNIVIVDDHALIRKGLYSVINDHPMIQSVDCVENGLKVLRKIHDGETIDVLITDIMMPEISGIDLCKKIREDNLPIKIMVVSQFKELWMLKQLLKLEIDAIILKSVDDSEVIKGLDSIIEGKKFYSQEIQSAIMDSFMGKKGPESSLEVELTMREKQVLKYIVDEYTSHEIADALNISKKTVDSHRNNLLYKLGVKNAAGLVKAAFERGLIS
ncbi:MAG: response regulator transcription factor [Bacteroidales bacterium]|nr:response regulator transcription factor [Bacteroidales bacterium]